MSFRSTAWHIGLQISGDDGLRCLVFTVTECLELLEQQQMSVTLWF